MKTPFKCNLIIVLFKTGNNLLVCGLKDGCGTWLKELKKKIKSLDGSTIGNGRCIV
jgi:hypothetical protein